MRARLATLLAKAAACLLRSERKRYVILNTEQKEGPPGRVLPFICHKDEVPYVAMVFHDDWLPEIGTPVPEDVALKAGWPTATAFDEDER